MSNYLQYLNHIDEGKYYWCVFEEIILKNEFLAPSHFDLQDAKNLLAKKQCHLLGHQNINFLRLYIISSFIKFISDTVYVQVQFIVYNIQYPCQSFFLI